ncbi:SEC-C metal-binding domain-containing protein [Tundrisphaera sp. TA3]|uniref:SEC-C metal-binding domain-containing protein n=1 Tax=Tundrisphaera sp. TA3 TaxID=3435775 RepID=UPI003EB8726B
MFDNRWDNWTSDFAESVDSRPFSGAVREFIPDILSTFGDAVREIDRDFPDEVSHGTFANVLGSTMTRLKLDAEVRAQVPEVIAAFFDHLQEAGKLGEGSDWAAQIRVIGKTFRERIKPDGGVKGVTIRKPANVSPLGRNDPCPCGSGKKFKKCCAIRA